MKFKKSSKTFKKAQKIARQRIQCEEDALSVALEMLDAIRDGKSYDSFEYIALTDRMREFDQASAIDSIGLRSHNNSCR
jgi:hypothetical protein